MKAIHIGTYINRAFFILVMLILLLGINPPERSQAQAPYVYYSIFADPYTVFRVDSDGTDSLTIHTPSNNRVTEIATDHVDKIYFYDSSDSGTIYKANFDSSSKSAFITGRATALAAGKGYVYYALNASPYALTRVNADGTNPVTIYTPPTGTVWAMAIDFLNDKLYFYDDAGSGTIYKSDLDGSNRTTFVTADIIALAVGGGYVYYSFSGDPWSLMRRNIDGTNPVTIYGPSDYVREAAVDPTGSKIYFSESLSGSEKIFKADLDGSNRTTFLSIKISALAVHGENSTRVSVNDYTGTSGKGSDHYFLYAGLLVVILIGIVFLKVRHIPT